MSHVTRAMPSESVERVKAFLSGSRSSLFLGERVAHATSRVRDYVVSGLLLKARRPSKIKTPHLSHLASKPAR
jgi:hypothetical protein